MPRSQLMQLFTPWIGFSIFIIGLVIGSFLNCLIYRLKIGKSMGGRSLCPNCSHGLSWHDLVPVLSYLELNGKCRYCKKPISAQYPLVEIAAGILFVAAAFVLTPQIVYNFDFSWFEVMTLIYYWTIISALLVVFVFDLKWYLIPDEAIIFSICTAAAYYLAQFFYQFAVTGNWNFEILINPVLAAVLAGSFFLAVFLFSKGNWMGFGDVKFSFLMGIILGFPLILPGLFFAFSIGAIIGLALILLKLKNISSEIPFGPFLSAGTAIALFYGENFINWYLSVTF